MSVGRLPLFCDTALAERIERAEAQLIAAVGEAARRRGADAADFVIPIAGGVASFAVPPCRSSSPTWPIPRSASS